MVTIRGSHGTLKVHRATGIIVEYEPDGDEFDYHNIARFDPKTLLHGDDFDILGTAYWMHDGSYEPALTMRTIVDWRGDYFDFDDWVPAALLPAPTTGKQHG
jgi:hypothetical protein